MSLFKQTFNRLSGFYKDGTAQYFKYVSYFVGAYVLYDASRVNTEIYYRAHPSKKTLVQNTEGSFDISDIDLPEDVKAAIQQLSAEPTTTH